MKKIISSLLLIPIFILLIVVNSSNNYIYAKDTEIENINLSKDEVINHDYFAVANSVNLSGTINGDAYIAGGNVTFDGIINGDLIVAGGNLTILGKVTGDVRAAGGNIIFSAEVDKNVTILGGSISLSTSGKISGSLASAGGNISINSPIGKGVNAAGGQISLGNSVGETVNIYTDNLILSPTTAIIGDLNYWSENKIQMNPEASIAGKINYHYSQTPQLNVKKANNISKDNKIFGYMTAGSLFFYLYNFIVTLIVGLLLIKLLPVFTTNTVKTLNTQPWISLGVGLIAVILFPIIFIILIITIIGIPVALMLLLTFIVLWFISQIFVALFLGSKILTYFNKQKSSIGWQLLTGLLILGVLSLIPVVNFLIGMLTYFIGIGALLIQKKNSYLNLRQKELI